MKAADKIRQQLARIMARFDLELCSTDFNDPDYSVNTRKAMLTGYPLLVAHLKRTAGSVSRGYYLTPANDKVHLHRPSCLGHKPEWVIYNECVVASRKFLQTVTQIPGEWLVAGVQNQDPF